jgi:hypothetical protein
VTTTPLTVPSSTTTPPTTAPPSSTTPSASTTPPTAPRTSQTPPPTFVQYDTPTPSTRPPLAATGTDRELRLRLTPGVLTVLGVCLVGTGLTLVLATRRARRRV